MSSNVINVRKASGELVPYNPQKVKASLKRAQVEPKVINAILESLDTYVSNNMTTKQLYNHVHALLREMDRPRASAYNLKQAIMDLGPSGYPFEKFIAGVLTKLGYETVTNAILQGRCITHETDIIANKGNIRYMIEAKFHNSPGTKTDAQSLLYTKARFDDVRAAWEATPEGAEEVHRAWVITNTKLTSEAVKYAKCVGIDVTGWDYPTGLSLRRLMTDSRIYPVTSLLSLNDTQKHDLISQDKVLCVDILDMNEEEIQKKGLQEALHEARSVCILPDSPISANIA